MDSDPRGGNNVLFIYMTARVYYLMNRMKPKLKIPAFIIILSFLFLIFGCATGVKETDLANEYYNIGNSYYNMEKYDDACRFFERALDFNPSFSKAKYNLAIASIKANKIEKAIAILEDLLDEDSENIDILSTLVYSYHEMGEYEKALSIITLILKAYPNNSYALYNGGILLWKLERIEEAIEYFILLNDSNPDDYDALYNLGNLYYQIEEYEEAVKYLEQFSEKNPGDGNTYLLLARSYTGLEKYLLALDAYDLTLSFYPEHQEAWFEKAVIFLTKVMEPEKGFIALSQALELGFNNPEKIDALLNDPQFMEKDRLEILLKERNLFPIPTDDES